MTIKTNQELAAACKNVAENFKTLYVMGCFGAPMTPGNKTRYTQNHSYNRKATRAKKIKAASADTFGFDCVCLIKGLLWGWDGDKGHTYGGARYNTNGVPDINADQMIKACKGVTTNFSTLEVGEAVWMPGHIGIYIGNGLAVECSPKWADSVQITAVGNVPHPAGYNVRTWTKHGKLPYISYVQQTPDDPDDLDTLAMEVIGGKWGVNPERKQKLTAAGHDYQKVQKRVNEIIDRTVGEVIAGKWGNNPQRKQKLEAAGFDPDYIQKLVNEKLRK